MRKISCQCWWSMLMLVVLTLESIRCDRDSCDLDDPTLKRLCRKVESQEKYQEKWVTTNFKAETVFRWYNSNKDWLTAPRLSRMMKRLLRRASALNPSENDDFADEQPGEPASPAVSAVPSPELEAKLEQMTQQLSQMALQLNQTQSQLRQLQHQSRKPDGRADELNAVEIRVNASLAAHQERLKIQTNMSNESLQRVISAGEQMATRLSKTEKAIQSLKNNCNCSSAVRPSSSSSRRSELESETSDDLPTRTSEEFQKFQWDIEREVEQLKMKLQLTASDLEKSINSIQVNSEGALRNFSAVYHEGMKSLASVLEDKVSLASTSSYDVITNATLAFGEDLQVLRQAVSSSAAQIQYLVAQDMKSIRGLEELRSGNRRHESNIQLLTTQLGDFKQQVQDQLNNVRTHFSQAVTEYYQKIAERQSSMSYRLTSIIDELATVKGKVRNIPLANTSAATGNDQGAAADNDEDPLFPPLISDSR